ncbi:MAG: DUF58 domain-containing protein [Bacteroidales bacterium]|jgi:uncharacterized protein (DUF58 family)|nr:DUF58 domain-containing protein [Bacteroidales bacterium]MEE1113287.1 DUF58 domain-containing protein [Bacteroidales bacterium]MEE1143378.1 DUF58 domain-containing protein [Bacteroidales bacterium]MEE1225641.1 DUF58 domain-containing protein [Bacteroidales bacterium]
MSEELRDKSLYNSIDFKTTQIVEGFMTGFHKSPFHGFSVEFAEHRLYNTGESTKYIDWRLYARTDKLFVKRFEEETNLRTMFVLDSSSSMFFPYNQTQKEEKNNKFSFSVYACGVIMQILYKQRDAFGLSFVSKEIDYISPIKTNLAHKQYLFTLLENKIKTKENLSQITCINKALHSLSEQIHRRSLFIIFTDLFSDNFSAEELIDSLRHLKHNKHEVILFHVFDNQKEVNFDYKMGYYRFIDVESGEELKINPEEIRNQYTDAIKQRLDLIRSECNKLKIDFVQADINKGFDQILFPFLIKRSKLK